MSGLVIQERNLEKMPLLPGGSLLPQRVDQGGLDRNQIGSPLLGWDILMDPVQRLTEGFLLSALHLLQGGAAVMVETVEPLLHPAGD